MRICDDGDCRPTAVRFKKLRQGQAFTWLGGGDDLMMKMRVRVFEGEDDAGSVKDGYVYLDDGHAYVGIVPDSLVVPVNACVREER